MRICVYGAASNKIDNIFILETERLGKEIGKRGHKLIYGAGATGMMGATARGVRAAGGYIIGVAPHFMSSHEPLFECDEMLYTETMADRKTIMEENADAFIITPGGVGTYDEFFQLITLIELDRKSAPVIIYNVEGYFDNMIQMMHDGVDKGFIRPIVLGLFAVATDPVEALDGIENYFSNGCDQKKEQL